MLSIVSLLPLLLEVQSMCLMLTVIWQCILRKYSAIVELRTLDQKMQCMQAVDHLGYTILSVQLQVIFFVIIIHTNIFFNSSLPATLLEIHVSILAFESRVIYK